MTVMLTRPTDEQSAAPPESAATPPAPPAESVPPRSGSGRVRRRAVPRWLDNAIAWPLAVAMVVLIAWNIGGFPTASDDEGTYLAQAWAVREGLGLAHYTYWYDHPPLAWIQLALVSWIPESLAPEALVVAAGRTVMLPVALITLVLTYVLGRRLGFAPWTAALAMLLYGLSPLAVTMLRQIYLDSFAVVWILAAFVLALSPRRHLWAYVSSGLAAGVAVISKETIAVVLPALFVAVWQSTRGIAIRPWAIAGFVTGLSFVGVSYPLYAVLNGELLPGPDHVSLLGAIQYQLHSRSGSGSVFVAGSNANGLVNDWLYYDTILPLGGLAAAVLAVVNRRLRAPALALLMLVLVALRPGGYLPAMYIVQTLPFLAILLAGAAQVVVAVVLVGDRRRARAWFRLVRMRSAPVMRAASVVRVARLARLVAVLDRLASGRVVTVLDRWLFQHRRPARPGAAAPRGSSRVWSWVQLGLRVALVVGLACLVVAGVAPRWYDGHRRSVTENANATYQAAASWLRANLDPDAVVLTDDVLWLDIVLRAGLPREQVIWFYKLDLDPQVARRYPGGWRDVDYVVSTPALREDPTTPRSRTSRRPWPTPNP